MKTCTLFLITLLPIFTYAQTDRFTITGKIGNVNNTWAYVDYRSASVAHHDSTIIKNGLFKIQGYIDYPVKAYFRLVYRKNGTFSGAEATTIYLEKGTIKIESNDSLKNAAITGSKLTTDYKQYEGMMKEVYEKRRRLNADYASSSGEIKKDSTFLAGYYRRSDSIRALEQKIQCEFIKGHSNSLLSIDALQNYAGVIPSDLNKVDSLFHLLSPVVQRSVRGKEYGELIRNWKVTAIGAMAPVFVQNDTVGRPVSLEDFRGKYVLVDFWASWCVPCRAENPHLVKTYSKYKDRNFAVLGVSLDQSNGRENWLKAIRKDGLLWTQVSDLRYWDNAAAKLYAVRGIPQNFLIDPNGKIIAKNLRGDALDKELEKYLPGIVSRAKD